MTPVDEEAKKTTLRMMPYALYVMSTRGKNGDVNAAIMSWATQCSFKPPLVAVGVKEGSKSHAFIRETGVFALNLLGEHQKEVAVGFFKDLEAEHGTYAGHVYREGETGAPIFPDLPAYVECRVVGEVAKGDHTLFVAEVVAAGVHREGTAPLTHGNTGWHYGG